MKRELPEILNRDEATAEDTGKDLQIRDDLLNELNKDVDKIVDPSGPATVLVAAVALGLKLLFSSASNIAPTPKPFSIPTTVGFRMQEVLIEAKPNDTTEQAGKADPCSRLPSTVVVDKEQERDDKRIVLHRCRPVPDETNEESDSASQN